MDTRAPNRTWNCTTPMRIEGIQENLLKKYFLVLVWNYQSICTTYKISAHFYCHVFVFVFDTSQKSRHLSWLFLFLTLFSDSKFCFSFCVCTFEETQKELSHLLRCHKQTSSPNTRAALKCQTQSHMCPSTDTRLITMARILDTGEYFTSW